jgi:hypothetical protein
MHTGAVAETLNAKTVIDKGGWHPRYARVLLVLQRGDEALVLVETGTGTVPRWRVNNGS